VNKSELLLLIFILLVAFLVRLYKINRPLADWQSWRQADTAAVSRNFIKEGFNPFIPTYDDMSSQTNGLDNPSRYRFVEFPIYNGLIAAVWSQTGINVIYARLVTVVVTLFSTTFLYFLVRKFSGVTVAALSAFFFATIPYNVFYSSTILPAPLMTASVLGLYLSFTNWLEKEKSIVWGALSVIFANIAVLAWPIALFFMLPIIYMAFQKYGIGAIKKLNLWVFAILSLVPFLLWRAWMTRFPAGIPNWQFLINEGNIRFKGAFFRWLIAERLGNLILTVGGFALFILGLVKKPQPKEKFFYYSWLVSVALYFTVFASGNVRHDYYQIPTVPILAIFMALGVKFLMEKPTEYLNKYVGILTALALVLFMYAFGFYNVQGNYWINRPQIVEAGQAVDKLLPKNATVIAPYNGDTAFLYQTNRHGYPIVDRPLSDFVKSGTQYLVSVDVNDAGIANLAKNCRTLEKTADYVIIQLSLNCVGQ